MKKTKILALFALLSVLLCSASCRLGIKTLSYDKQAYIYTEKSSGVSYLTAPLCYEAVSIAGEYAVWDSGRADVVFYGIGDKEPLEWLTVEDKTVFYADSLTLPSLDDMQVSEAIVCAEGEYTVAIAKITEGAELENLKSLWLRGDACDCPLKQTENKYRLKFASEKYDWLYYSLSYIEDGEGGYYLYDRYADRCVSIGEAVNKYINGSAE